MEKKYTLNAVKLDRNTKADDDGLVMVEGYACHFGKPNMNGEIVNEDSFKNFFEVLKAGGQMPMFNYNHDTDKIIGGWDSIVSDEKGLYVKGHINTKVAFVRDFILPLMESGDLNGLSTEGYVDWETMTWLDDGNRVCHDFALCGISLVALPADFAAGIEARNRIELERKSKEGKHFENNLLLI